MSSAQSTTRTVYIDSSSAELQLERLEKKAAGFDSAIEKARNRQKELNAEIIKLGPDGAGVDKLDKEYQKLQKDIEKATKDQQANTQKMREQKELIERGFTPTIKQQEAAVRELTNRWKNCVAGTDEEIAALNRLKKAQATLDEMKAKLHEVNDEQKKMTEGSGFFSKAFLANFAANALSKGIDLVSQKFQAFVAGNAAVSDALSDMEKATGLSANQVAELDKELLKIDTRTKAEDLREIAVGLGQIGEAANASNVAAIDQIVVALGDEFGGGAKQITTTLSVLRNNLQDIKTGNYGDDVTKLGNALNVLGAEGLATAPVVTEFANRMAGIAGTFKLTSGEILGVSATMQELGIEVERGSTAFTKVLQKIAAEPGKFAKVAGIPIKEFTNLVNTDMLAAFNAVAVGAGKASGSNTVFASVLKELDADGSGAGEVLSKLAKNQELLTGKVDLASRALKDQSSITDEFNKKNNNLAANLEKLSKRFTSFFTNGAIADLLNGLVSTVVKATEPVKSLTQQFDEQLKTVVKLETQTTPLINRYDQLSAKAVQLGGTTKLSKDEQAEMKTIIDQVAQTIPSAITQVDAYGNAIAISTTRVREYINTEKDRLKVVNASAIDEIKGQISEVDKQYGVLQKRIDERNAKGFFGVQVKGEDGKLFTRKSTEAEIRELDTFYREVISKRNGLNAELKRLNGDALQEQLDAQKKAQEAAANNKQTNTDVTNPLATGDATDKLKKLREEYAKLRGDITSTINELERSAFANSFDKIFKEKAEQEKLVNQSFQAGIITAKQRDQDLLDIQRATSDKLIKLNEELTAKMKDNPVKIPVMPEVKEEDIDIARAALRKAFSGLEKAEQDRVAARSLVLLKGTAKQRMDAQLEIFKEERATELANKNLTENEKALVEAKYQDKVHKTRSDFFKSSMQEISEVLGYASQAIDILAQFDQAKTNRENAALEKELKGNEDRKAAYKRQLDSKLITQQQYLQQVDKIDKESQAKKDALEKAQNARKRKISIAQAIINGALGVTNAFATAPTIIAGVIMAALVAATTAAQIATISSQKFAKGGLLKGDSHSNGGMPVINRKTGKAEAEVEGGEVILSKSTVKNNWDYISPLLASSMHQGGRRITPWWQSRSYQAVNYPVINTTFTKQRMFANGGLFNPAAAATATTSGTDEEMKGLMRALLFRAENPVAPVIDKVDVSVPLTKLDQAEAMRNRIDSDAAFG